MNSFFELLRLSLGNCTELSKVPSAREWEELFEVAKQQAVVGVFFDGIERLSLEQRPDYNLMLKWIGVVQMIEASAKHNLKRTKELVAKFDDAGYESCVLKGVSAARYYPHPLRRQCGDIDLWTFERRRDVMLWLRDKYEIEHQVWHNVGVEIFDDVPVEVHFHPAWVYTPSRNYRLQRFFDIYRIKFIKDLSRGENKKEEGFNIMPVEFDVVFSLVHSFRHFLAEGLKMRQVCDYFFILKRCQIEHVDLKKSVGIIESIGLGRYASAMMYVLCEVLGMPETMMLCEPNEKEGRFLMKDIVSFGNYEQPYRGDGRKRFKRFYVMLNHYPSEVLWMFPWKIWHWFWRMVNK